MVDDHITEEEFLLEFFGLFGRELGNPTQRFTDNPQDIIAFVKENNEKKLPSFISVQPRRAHDKIFGIEKLFFDFDYADKTFIKKLAKSEPDEKKRTDILEGRKTELEIEVKKFVGMLMNWKPNIQPMVVRTMKGYHVYIYFDRVYSINRPEVFIREVYITLIDTFRGTYQAQYHNMKYLDPDIKKDVKRMSRVPLSIHEKSGKQCLFVKLKNFKFEEDKIRGLASFKNYGLKERDLIDAIKITERRLAMKEKEIKEGREEHNQKWEMTNGFIGNIRICFLKALESKEMPHKQRLALLLEGWYSGKRTKEELVDLFRNLNDFNVRITEQQVDWFLSHEIYNDSRPYTCQKLQELGYCIYNNCPIFVKRNQKI